MKRAIVMGASSGLGYEVALLLLQKGWQVGVAARRTALLEQLRGLYPSQVVLKGIDVMQSDAPERLVELAQELGGVELYCHVAGTGKQNPRLDEAIEHYTVNTNVVGFTRMVDRMFGYMAERGGGHIAVISSIAGTKGLGPAPSYSASKAFQSTYVQALEQLSLTRNLHITFTDIRPGFVATDLLSGNNYPMLMTKERVARAIVRAVEKKKHVCIIDRRYAALVFVWRLIPNCLWRRLKLVGRTVKGGRE